MGNVEDISHLSEGWVRWGRIAGLRNVRSPDISETGELKFTSENYSVYIRDNEGLWTVDTVDERGEIHSDYASFSSFVLCQKFLLWDWASAARSARRLSIPDPKLYDLGMNPNVQATALKTGIYKIQTRNGWAILMEPSATIFSHLIQKSLGEIEDLYSQGL